MSKKVYERISDATGIAFVVCFIAVVTGLFF